jgi:hypothetical protein
VQPIDEMELYRRLCLAGGECLLLTVSDDVEGCRLDGHFLDVEGGELVLVHGQISSVGDGYQSHSPIASGARSRITTRRVALAYKKACRRSLETRQRLTCTVNLSPDTLLTIDGSSVKLGYTIPGVSLLQTWHIPNGRWEWSPMVSAMEHYEAAADLMFVSNSPIAVVVFFDQDRRHSEPSLDGSRVDVRTTGGGAGLLLVNAKHRWTHRGPWIQDDGEFGEWPLS